MSFCWVFLKWRGGQWWWRKPIPLQKRFSASPENGPFQKERILPNIHFQVQTCCYFQGVYILKSSFLKRRLVPFLRGCLGWLQIILRAQEASGIPWWMMMITWRAFKNCNLVGVVFPNPFGQICNRQIGSWNARYPGQKQKIYETATTIRNSLRHQSWLP